MNDTEALHLLRTWTRTAATIEAEHESAARAVGVFEDYRTRENAPISVSVRRQSRRTFRAGINVTTDGFYAYVSCINEPNGASATVGDAVDVLRPNFEKWCDHLRHEVRKLQAIAKAMHTP